MANKYQSLLYCNFLADAGSFAVFRENSLIHRIVLAYATILVPEEHLLLFLAVRAFYAK